jgi:hypothetical protein
VQNIFCFGGVAKMQQQECVITSGITFRLHVDVKHHFLALLGSAILGLRVDVLALRGGLFALTGLALVACFALVFLALTQDARVGPTRRMTIISNYLWYQTSTRK